MKPLALIALAIVGCSTGNQPTGHTTTLPPLPTCLVFCFAHVESTIEATSTTIQPPPKKKKGAQPASAPGPASAPVLPPPPAQKASPTIVIPIPDVSPRP